MTETETPLARRLARIIRATGPLTVAEYMAACLGDPEHGYYRHRDPLGLSGDFITAPEISQVFGELIGVWCVAVWQAMGQPEPFTLAELGPGRGTLMADLLRAARIRPGFGNAARLHLVETSPRLKAIQAERLAASGVAPAWHERLATVPRGPLILVANEFFDALPIRQLVRTGTGWAERMVGLDAEGRLAFGLLPLSPPSAASDPLFAFPLGSVQELRPAGEALAFEIGERLAIDGGAALIIDYGHAEAGLGDTLQAVRAHAFDHPLAHPGDADLSAHVDFAALARAAAKAGASPRAVMNQADFLGRLGLSQRAETLAAGRGPPTGDALRAAAARLADRDEMGELFKILCISTPGFNLPVFDSP